MRSLRSTGSLLARAVLAVLVLVACGGSDTEDVAFDPGPVVERAATRLEQAASFRFVLEHERGATKIIQGMQMTRAEGVVIRPARLQADLDAETSGQKLELRMVGIDRRTWLSNPFDRSRWQELPGIDARDVLNLEQVPAVMRAMTGLEPAGAERIDGTRCYRVRGTLDSSTLALMVPEVAEPGHTVRVELWAGADDDVTRRIVVRGALNDDEPTDIERMLELSGFDEPATVEPPEPAP
jgi:hypothetical protein